MDMLWIYYIRDTDNIGTPLDFILAQKYPVSHIPEISTDL
jgi:hypothetical protein